MVEDTRDQSMVMRHRGAGTRDLATADFAMDFDAGSREERQLMRQRGAGTRHVETFDFGFHFATPSTVRSHRSAARSRSPQTATRRPQARQRTPKVEPNGASVLRPASVRSTRTQRSVIFDEQDREYDLPEPPSRKRRRLSEVSNMTRASSVVRPFSSIGDQLAPGVEADTQPEDQSFSVPSLPVNGSPRRETDKNAAPPLLPVIPSNRGKRRKRKSIVQQTSNKKKRRTASLQTLLPTPPRTQEDNGDQAGGTSNGHLSELQTADRSPRRSRHWTVESQDHPSRAITRPRRSLPVHQTSVTDSTSLDVENERKEESTSDVANQAHSHRSLSTGSSQLAVADTTLSDDGTVDAILSSDEMTLEATQADEEPDTPVSNTFGINYDDAVDDGLLGLQSSDDSDSDFPPQGIIGKFNTPLAGHDDEEADETYLPERKTAVGHVKRRSRTNKGPKSSSLQKKPRKLGIPILTYRIANVHKLPTILEEHTENLSELDIDELTQLALPAAFTARKSPNALDVLRQACHEAVDTRISELQETAIESGYTKSELKNCIAALQSLKTSLSIQLFQVSQSLDHRLNLEARVRKSRREKAELQMRWLEIRKRRDQLDLEKDAIRRAHWENDILDRKRFEASQAAFAAENAVARQRDGENSAIGNALEFQLRALAGEASNKDGGGLLQNLKNFNMQLERIANKLT